MAKIVVSEFMDVDALQAGLAGHEVIYDEKLFCDPDRLCAVVADADALIVRNRTQVREGVLGAGKRLRAVGRLGVGLDNIDVAACKARGIAVYPATGANDVSVAEYVLAAAMLLLRGSYAATSDVAAGKWPRDALSSGREIFGKRLGLIGFGSIARETAKRAAALGMSIAAYDPLLSADDPAWRPPYGEVASLPLEDVLASADIVSLHVPLTDATRGLIGRDELALMKRDAILINAARGGVVDEAALAGALRAGALGGAALDVFDKEPLGAGQGSQFSNLPNVILTPHIAGVTAESNIRVSQMIVEAIARHLEEA